MDDNKIFELFQKLTDKLQDNTDALREMLSNHETRIVKLEVNKDEGLKTKLLEWLAKGLLIALGIIATSAGAASVLKPIIGL